MWRDIKRELRGQDKEDKEVEIHRTNTGDRHCNGGEGGKKKNTKKNERASGSFINHARIQAAAPQAFFFFFSPP